MAQRVGKGIALLFHDRGTRRGWVVGSTPRPHFTPGKDPVPILQEAGWAPGPVWTGGKSRPHWHSIPDRPARSSVAIPTELPGPTSQGYIQKYENLKRKLYNRNANIYLNHQCLARNQQTMSILHTTFLKRSARRWLSDEPKHVAERSDWKYILIIT